MMAFLTGQPWPVLKSLYTAGAQNEDFSAGLKAELNVAKCNLGKVNLEAMLVSSFPSYSWGGPMPLAGAPRDLYTQLLACSSSQSVVAIACCLRASLCFLLVQ